MYLASAGRLYSRKSSEEEFSRYVYDCGVMDAFRAALICLYELPIKPLNLEEYFAEFLESQAHDLIELSILRAELGHKRAEAQDLRIRHENLDQKIVELEKKAGLTNEAFQWMFQSSTPDQDEKKYEIMRRFFKDIEEYHPSVMHRPGTAILKEEEAWAGMEGEWYDQSENHAIAEDPRSLKKDSYESFVNDMKKFDPWGLLFPYVHRNKDPLLPPQESDHEAKTFSTSASKQAVMSEMPVPSDLYDYQVQQLAEGIDPTGSAGDLDDSKSIAEMIMEEQMDALEEEDQEKSLKLRQQNSTDQTGQPVAEETLALHEMKSQEIGAQETGLTNRNPEEGDPAKLSIDRKISMDKKTGSTFKNICSLSSDGFHTWDTEYWKQFFKDGDIAPNFAIRAVDSHSSIFGNWNAPNKDIQLQYFNPQRFSDVDSLDTEFIESGDNPRTSVLEQDLGKTSVAAKQYAYQHVWTSSKFIVEPLPFIEETASPSIPFNSQRRSSALRQRWQEEEDMDNDDDVINTDISFGDPSLRCKQRLRTVGAERIQSESRGASAKNSFMSALQKLPSNLSINRPIPSGKSYPSDTSIEDHDPERKLEPQWKDERESRAASVARVSQAVVAELANQQIRGAKASGPVVKDDGQRKSKVSATNIKVHQRVSTARGEAGSQDGPTNPENLLPQSSKCINRIDARSDLFRKRLTESMAMVRSQQQVHAVASRYPGNPCDPEQIHHFHPYPELLDLKKSSTPPKPKEQRFLKFCKEHYDEDTIRRFQRDYDFSLFDDML